MPFTDLSCPDSFVPSATPSIPLRIECLAGSIKEGESLPQDTGPISSALHNVVILDAIFSKLDVPTLKSIRCVSMFWANIGASLLGRRTFIDVTKLLPPCCTGCAARGKELGWPTQSELLFSLPEGESKKIFKNLTLDFWCYCQGWHHPMNVERPQQANMVTLRNCLPLVSQLNDTLVDLHIKFVPLKFFTTTFLNMFSTIKFPKLKKININWIRPYTDITTTTTPSDEGGALKGTPVFTCLELTQLIELQIYWDSLYSQTTDFENRTKQLHSVFQSLIYSAPNLKILWTIGNNFYPDLSGSGKLVELNFTGFSHLEIYSSITEVVRLKSCDFDLREVSRMVGQVKTQLVKLSLANEGSGYPLVKQDTEVDTFHLPHLPKLTSFHVDIDCYNIRKFLNPTVLPGLYLLQLSRCSSQEKYTPLDLYLPHPGIQELFLDFSIYSDRALNLQTVNLFPNTKKVKLTMAWHGYQFKQELEPILTWDLSHSYIYIILVRDHEFAGVLEAVGKLKGIKKLVLHQGAVFVDDEDATTQCLDAIKSSLYLYSPEDHITIFDIRMLNCTLEAIKKIAVDRNLQIVFK